MHELIGNEAWKFHWTVHFRILFSEIVYKTFPFFPIKHQKPKWQPGLCRVFFCYFHIFLTQGNGHSCLKAPTWRLSPNTDPTIILVLIWSKSSWLKRRPCLRVPLSLLLMMPLKQAWIILQQFLWKLFHEQIAAHIRSWFYNPLLVIRHFGIFGKQNPAASF